MNLHHIKQYAAGKPMQTAHATRIQMRPERHAPQEAPHSGYTTERRLLAPFEQFVLNKNFCLHQTGLLYRRSKDYGEAHALDKGRADKNNGASLRATRLQTEVMSTNRKAAVSSISPDSS